MRTFFYLGIFGLVISACGAKQNPSSPTATDPSVSTASTSTSTPSVSANPSTTSVDANGQTTAIGVVQTVEAADYPRGYFECQIDNKIININFMEEAHEDRPAVKSSDLEALKGKKSIVKYVTKMENFLTDVRLNGKSLLGNSAAPKPELKKVSGILNAPETTKGDLPDEISVKTANGEEVKFLHFVDDKMVKANGKTVEAYYSIEAENHLISASLAPQ